MTMLALVESDKQFNVVAPKGVVMLNTRTSLERMPTSTARHPDLHANPTSRRAVSPADQLMYAWSMSAPKVFTQPVARVKKEECPPEVYLG